MPSPPTDVLKSRADPIDRGLLKIMVTKEYHRAQNAYKRECKDKGIEVNAEDMKTYVSKKVAKFKSDVASGLVDID